MTMTIDRMNGTRVEASYSRHVTTWTHDGDNVDVDVYRLADGTEIMATSPANSGRAIPDEIEWLPGTTAGASKRRIAANA